mmetsp:Transcript_4458/g.5169  ORF Transcript_4458/g.5169 Transcript_4458/m.5169 type:complete len:216 (-) Transcript_4458:83-730(-)
MSSSQPLRRSRRGRRQAYSPGDKVEILRDEGIAIGKLIQKVHQDSEGESSVLHWIVSFDGESEKEEITEKYIGRLVESSETESHKSNNLFKISSANTNKSGNKNSIKAKKSHRILPRAGKYENSSQVRPSTRSTAKHKCGEKKLKCGEKTLDCGEKKIKCDEKKNLKANKNIKKISKDQNRSTNKKETVVKVKMLTGTLYLYRGNRPRAEFIRTV